MSAMRVFVFTRSFSATPLIKQILKTVFLALKKVNKLVGDGLYILFS
jgi:hypothetical protein